MKKCPSAVKMGYRFRTSSVEHPLSLLMMVGPRGSAVERQSLASVLSPSCARPVADG